MSEGGKQVSILLVEDQLTQAMLMQHQLKKSGFTVKLARNGQAALTELGQGQYDIVLTDINMPTMGGYELCRAAKVQWPALPVVLLATPVEQSEIWKALECGADNLIYKAYDEANFIGRLRDILATMEKRNGSAGGAKASVVATFGGQELMVETTTERSTDMLFSAFDMFLFELKKQAAARATQMPTA